YTDYQVYLGGASLGVTDRIEIAHGPQSTLYGGEAVGGVVSISAQRGRGAPTASVNADGGSFGTIGGGVVAQGASDGWAYALSANTGHTDNDRPNNEFTHTNAVLRFDRTLNANVGVG